MADNITTYKKTARLFNIVSGIAAGFEDDGIAPKTGGLSATRAELLERARELAPAIIDGKRVNVRVWYWQKQVKAEDLTHAKQTGGIVVETDDADDVQTIESVTLAANNSLIAAFPVFDVNNKLQADARAYFDNRRKTRANNAKRTVKQIEDKLQQGDTKAAKDMSERLAAMKAN